jgi:S1-C subfamily serine protease
VTSRDLGVTFGRATDRGLLIQDISRNAVLANIGLRRDDVIVSVADHRIRSERDFTRWLFAEDLRDETITIIVLRDDREVPIEVRPVTIIEELVLVQDDYDPLQTFGVVLDDRRDREILVQRVIPESPAFVAGIRAGDVITTFRGRPVTGRQQFVQVLETVEPGEVAIGVNRNRQVQEFQVDLPRFERRTSARPDFDIDRPGVERREDRRDIRTERRIDRRDGVQPAPVPANQPRPARPAILPRNK